MSNSKWHDLSQAKLAEFRGTVGKRRISGYKLDLLKRIISRIEEYSKAGCERCNDLKQNVDHMITLLPKRNTGDATVAREYKNLLHELITHLKKGHGLIEEGTYLLQWTPLGMVFGVAFLGVTTENVGVGIALGFVIGAGIGTMMDDKAKKQGEVI